MKYIKKALIFTEHEDGRRGGEIARTVLWNSEFIFSLAKQLLSYHSKNTHTDIL